MKRAIWVLPFVLFVAVAVAVPGEGANAGREGKKIEWPGRDSRDLQSVIDAAPDGATIQIKEGVYRFSEPLYVRGKRLTLIGAGSGLRAGRRITQLAGPSPNPVVDERGNLILFADAVVGLLNLIAADVEIRDMQITGFDAGIVSRADERGNAGPTVVTHVLIMDTGRGILSVSPSDLTVQNTTIINTQWHGISVAPPQASPVVPKLHLISCRIVHPGKAGIFCAFGDSYISDVVVFEAQAGGIVAYEAHNLIVHGCLLGSNKEAGVLIEGGDPLGFFIVNENTIANTYMSDDGYADGILTSVWTDDQQSLSIDVTNNHIYFSDRAGVSAFGTTLNMKNNDISCSAFALDGEQFSGIDYTYKDLGKNYCGCPDPDNNKCSASSSMLKPPPPVGGLE